MVIPSFVAFCCTQSPAARGRVELVDPTAMAMRGDGAGDVIMPTVTRERLSADPSTWAPKLTTTCPVMDRWLRGGVPTRHVTELTGEAGAAKTQLVLQLLLNAQLPREVGGLDGAAARSKVAAGPEQTPLLVLP